MIHLSFRILPALHSLCEVMENIIETHGEDRAEEWFAQALNADFDLFVEISTAPPSPQLTIIRGGK